MSHPQLSTPNATLVPSKPQTAAVMPKPDELYATAKIRDRHFDYFSDLRTYIKQEYPAKLANFDRKYGKCSSS
jgi:hypothetical protein